MISRTCPFDLIHDVMKALEGVSNSSIIFPKKQTEDVEYWARRWLYGPAFMGGFEMVFKGLILMDNQPIWALKFSLI